MTSYRRCTSAADLLKAQFCSFFDLHVFCYSYFVSIEVHCVSVSLSYLRYFWASLVINVAASFKLNKAQ